MQLHCVSHWNVHILQKMIHGPSNVKNWIQLKKTLNETGYENQRSIELAEGCVKWWASVIVVFNLQVYNSSTFLLVRTSGKHSRFIKTVLVNSVVFLGIFCSSLHELNLSSCNSGNTYVSTVHILLTTDKAGKLTHHVFSWPYGWQSLGVKSEL